MPPEGHAGRGHVPAAVAAAQPLRPRTAAAYAYILPIVPGLQVPCAASACTRAAAAAEDGEDLVSDDNSVSSCTLLVQQRRCRFPL